MSNSSADSIAHPSLSLAEFTAMLAMLFATIAFSIDAMLPSLPSIAQELTPDAPNRAQLILSIFVMGMGVGTLFVGPMSDAWGRKPVIAVGLGLYVAAALAAHFSTGLGFLLIARFAQGIGAAAPRVVGMALIRDLFHGREMARVMSFVMMVFMVVPALAPMIGQGIIFVAGWRAIFLAYILFALTALCWIGIRQDETLAPADRRPLSGALILSGLREVSASAEVRLYTLVMALGFGQMLGLLSSIQQIFDQTWGRGSEFPFWFALIAAFSASASMVNGWLVGRLGMRRIALWAYAGQAVLSLAMLALFAAVRPEGTPGFAAFFVWATSIFFIGGLTFGNLNALAMQKMGHLAGMATSVITAVSTVISALIAAVVGLMFNDTPVPAMAGAVVCSALSVVLMRRAGRG